MAEGKRITREDMELTHVEQALPTTSLKEARENIEREMVIKALRETRVKSAQLQANSASAAQPSTS